MEVTDISSKSETLSLFHVLHIQPLGLQTLFETMTGTVQYVDTTD